MGAGFFHENPLVHETAHMCGLQHCIHYRCVLNGSNHLAESDGRPMHVCPMDLCKLQHSLGFDLAMWYARLLQFHSKTGFDDERDRTRARLGWLLGETAARELIERSGQRP